MAASATLLFASAVSGAQEPLRVLTWLPRDVARPTDVITITFDRPVAGTLEHSVDPSRIVRIAPAVQVRVEWRDPSTIRIVPLEPLLPGHRYDVTVDTGFTSFDGSKLAAPHRFTLSVRGPAFMGSFPRLSATQAADFNPTGRLLLTLSAPVPDSLLTRAVRFETRVDPACSAINIITYRVVRHRPIQSGDPWELSYREWAPGAAVSPRFREVVELMPEQPMPESCTGDLSIPSLDSLDSPVIRYPMHTARPFGLVKIDCGGPDCPTAKGITAVFNAPIAPAMLAGKIHVDPPAGFTPTPAGAAASSLFLTGKLEPRSTYRVTVDSSLRDIYDRPLTYGFERSVTVGDRVPDFGFASGLVYVPGNPVPTIRVRHLNVDSIALLLMPVPDSQRVRELTFRTRWYSEALQEQRRKHPDSVLKVIAVHAPFNEEGVTEVRLPELAGALSGRLVAVQARLHTAARRPEDIPLPRATRPPIVISADAPPTPKTVLQATNLIAHARLAADGGAIWVTSARTGRPVRGAHVELLDTAGVALAGGVTDEHGIANITLAHATARLLEVRLGRDRSVTDLSNHSGIDLTPTELGATLDREWLPQGDKMHAVLFADRGIYRPGEPVNIGAAIREGTLGQLSPPSAKDSARLHVERRTPDGSMETVRDTVVRLSRFGTLADHFRLKTEAPLGDYLFNVALVRDGKWRQFGSSSLRVGEYRAPEFLVTASADTTPHLRGDSIATRVAANYLFGAPMAKAEVSWSATFSELAAWNIKIPGVGREWVIGDQDFGWDRNYRQTSVQRLGKDSLDDAGVARLKIPTGSASFARGANVRIDVSVTDLNRQAVTATTSSMVHPASFYVALGDSSTSMWWPQDVSHRVRVMAARLDGRRVAGVAVRLAVIEHRYTSTSTSDLGLPVWKMTADTVRIDSVVTSESIRAVAIPALHDGWVEIVATATDEGGRLAHTSMSRYAYGGGAVSKNSPLRLPLPIARDRLKPGDTAIVNFVSPWPGADAWVTVEREGLMSERVLRDVHGSVTVRLPVTGREVPNAFVSVLLLRHGAIGTADSLAEHMRTGYAVLRVDDASKRLEVRVRALRQEYEPGDSATIELTARDARRRGAMAEATIWAVDEGVLALTGYTAPDPMRQLYAPVHDDVLFSSTLRSLPSGIPEFFWRRTRNWDLGEGYVNALSMSVVTGADAVDYQGRGILPGQPSQSQLRSIFRTTAFFSGGVHTDASGVARITVKLPDNVGTFRVMAVAVGAGDEYGSAEAPLLVTKPLIVRAAFPRFLRANDSVFAGAVINARDRVPRMIGATATGTNVRLVGESQTHTMLDAGGTEVRFSWRAMEADSARFRVSVTDGTHADAVAVTIPVKPDQAPRSHTITGMIADKATVCMWMPRNIDPFRSRLTIRTGTSPVPTLLVARDFLLASSYSCPDQLTSVGRMLVSLLELQRRGTKVLDDTLWARHELQRISSEITRRERSSWIFECWESPWVGSPVRAAANLLLLDMRDIGIQVDTMMVKRISIAFTHLLDSLPLFPDTTYGTRAERAERIASRLQARLGAISYLRRTGTLRERDLQLLWANEARLTWEDRAWLASLLEDFHDHAQARTLLDELWASLGRAGNRVEVPDSVLNTVGFPSHIRPIGRLLSATLAIAPDHPRLGALVERLTTRTRVERDEWWNTQDHVSATVSLSRFAELQRGRTGSLSVQFGPVTVDDSHPTLRLDAAGDTPRDTSANLLGMPLATHGDSAYVTLRLKASGGPQYYAVTLAEMTQERPTAPDIRGLVVERWYERFDDGRTVTELREGDLVRVRLRVTAPASRDFVAVEDVLPAGLETVDLTLRTSSALGPFSSAASDASAQRRNAEAGGTPNEELYGSWYGGWWSPWGQPERHDDRTVFLARKLWAGSFTLSYIARATTAGRFVRPQAHAEEAYNPAVNGRSEGGWFDVRPAIVDRKP